MIKLFTTENTELNFTEKKKSSLRTLCIFLSALCGLNFYYTTSYSQSLSLNSDSNIHWQFRKAGDTIWNASTVPGCVHTDLLANKLIPNPFYRDNENKVQWIENKD